MHLATSLTPKQLTEFLLAVAPRRPVMIWGQPGIGKTAIVEQFFAAVGLPCQSLLGSQLAPEDLMGVPQIIDGKTRFCPPGMIARDTAYGLFLDEINATSPDVSRAMYSLVMDGVIGEYRMPEGSVVIAAGNRAEDQAIVRTMPSALINRMVHVQLTVSHREWLDWGYGAGLSPLVLEYIAARPDHLVSTPSKQQAPFSTPRAWHYLSDAITSFSGTPSLHMLKVSANGLLTAAHAQSFIGFVKTTHERQSLSKILEGDARWPSEPDQRDALYFLAQSLRARLLKELPSDRSKLAGGTQDLSYAAKARIKDLAGISLEAAQTVLAADEVLGPLPAWFITEVARDVPRLAARDASEST